MKTLTSMMRKQKIGIDLQTQQLHALRQRCTAADRHVQQLREECRETEQYLWLQLAADREISLDRLGLARLRHGEQQDLCAHAERELQQLNEAVRQLEKAILLDEKKLEKFAEVFAERQRAGQREAQRQEWQTLDEHILATQRQRAS